MLSTLLHGLANLIFSNVPVEINAPVAELDVIVAHPHVSSRRGPNVVADLVWCRGNLVAAPVGRCLGLELADKLAEDVGAAIGACEIGLGCHVLLLYHAFEAFTRI